LTTSLRTAKGILTVRFVSVASLYVYYSGLLLYLPYYSAV